MVQQWQRQHYNIAMDTGWVKVDGIVMAEVPDLGLHINVAKRIEVTHLPTGKRIGNGFETLGGAMEFVHRIAYIRPWTLGSPEITPEEYTVVQTTYAHVLSTERNPEAVLL